MRTMLIAIGSAALVSYRAALAIAVGFVLGALGLRLWDANVCRFFGHRYFHALGPRCFRCHKPLVVGDLAAHGFGGRFVRVNQDFIDRLTDNLK